MPTIMSPIFVPRTQPERKPGSFVGIRTGLQTPMPWDRLDNPALDKFMLPGSEEFSPNALKERAKMNISTTTFAPSGQGGGAAGSGGSGPAYMPGGSPIGKGRPKAWSAPQQNFEDAKGKGALTPEKIAQAQAFAAANGRVFDPAMGYSTNTKPQPQAAVPVTAPAPSVGVPAAPSAKPTGSSASDPYPHVFDGGKPVLTQAAKDQGIAGWDENGSPQYAFADGTPPGGMPLQNLEGRTFVTGESGPELQQIKNGRLTVVPNEALTAGTFAPTNGPVLRTAPSADRVVATPATPQTAFPTQSTEQGFTPAFSPTFAPTLSAPPGVRQTDFRRFLRTPQGMQYALGHEAQNQGMAAHNQSRTAAMNTERGWQMEDKNAAKNDKAAEEQKTNAAYDQIFGALTSDKAALPPVFNDLIASAKDVKSKAALHDLVLNYLGHKATGDEMANRQEASDKRKSVTGADFMQDPSGVFGVPMVTHADGSKSLAGGAMPLPKPMNEMTDAEIADHVRRGASVTTKRGSATVKYAPPAEKSARAPAIREVRTPGGVGQPDAVSYLQWYPEKGAWGPMAQEAGAGGARKPSAFTQKFAAPTPQGY